MFGAVGGGKRILLSQELFRRMLSREAKRARRFGRHLLLMLIEANGIETRDQATDFEGVGRILPEMVRETDLAGWFEEGSMMGVIFTEVGETEPETAAQVLEKKIVEAFRKALAPRVLGQLLVSFIAYPDGWADDDSLLSRLEHAMRPDFVEVMPKGRISPGVGRSGFPSHIPVERPFSSTGTHQA